MLRPHFSLRAITVFLIVCVLPSVALAQMPHFDSLYVFGDSLADNGNILAQSKLLGQNPAVPPSASPHRTYFNGRFSNGYVEFEYLWQRLTGNAPVGRDALKPFLSAPFISGPGGIDFAYGGTGTPLLDQTPGGMWSPGLLGQIELFRFALHGQKPSSRALYAIATGSNDYRDDQFNVPMDPAKVVRNIEDGIVSLYGLGARDVLVFDLPDFSLIPANGGDPNASAISTAHNALLYQRLDALRRKYPKLHLITVKLDVPLHNLVQTMEWHAPALEVFYPGMSPCLFIDPNLCHDVSTSLFNANLGFLFWDIVHPTTEAHRYLSDYLYGLLVASYN